MAAHMENMYLKDADTNEEYTIIVSSEDAEKARQASTSMNTTSSSNTSRSINDENKEGTHIWSKSETLLLISIYKEYKEEFYDGKCSMKQCWEKIAKIMRNKGYNVTGLKCCTKLQALKRTYKVIIDHNKKSGNNTKKWEYFQIIHELYRDKPWVQPTAVAGSHVKEKEEEEQKMDEPLKTCIKKRKLNTLIEQYMMENKEEQKKRLEIRRKQHTERMSAFKRIENLMQQILEKKH